LAGKERETIKLRLFAIGDSSYAIGLLYENPHERNDSEQGNATYDYTRTAARVRRVGRDMAGSVAAEKQVCKREGCKVYHVHPAHLCHHSGEG